MDWGIRDGPSDFGPKIRHECSVEANMGAHGKAYTSMVSYPTANGEHEKDPTYGQIAGNHC